MGQAALPTRETIARKLASSLEEVADRLGSAASVAEFVAALDDNRLVWEGLRHAVGRYGWSVPARQMAFALDSSARARAGLSDHDVEAMIALNRRTSSALRADDAEALSRAS